MYRHFVPGLVLTMLLSLCAPGTQEVCAQVDPGQYGRRIIQSADASKSAVNTAQALQHWLDRMTEAKFSRSDQAADEGIYLVTEDSPLLTRRNLPELRKVANPEAFQIIGDRDQLWIVGKTDVALDRGVYWYLDKLGCRWLHPSERWTIIPRRTDITLNIDAVQAPAFEMRSFAGTGYFGRPAIDPKQRMADAWALYQRQNLLGGNIRLGGHAGEAFALKHRDVWVEHPEYLAENNGQRQVWSPRAIVKLCTSNPGLQALWVKDRVDILKAQLAANPLVRTVSVEPSDGGGHCDCSECLKLGSVSDRVFTLANLVAREVRRQFPGKYVNLYAYNEHAASPNIDIEPNVIVSIVPYGFQRTGLTPEEFIVAWEKKCGRLAMYDYWNIPDWSHNLPDLSTETVVDKLRFWHAHGVKYFQAESTYCGGSMGLNWYLASRLLWDPARDEAAIIDDYFQNAFGPAQAPIRRMYDRWSSGFILSDHELGLCFRDLQQSLTLTDDPAIIARIDDLVRYVHFMGLWYEYLSATQKSPERVARAREFVHYLWQNYESNMLQSFRLAQLINRDEKPALDDINPDNPKWKDIAQLSDTEVQKLLGAGIKKYKPLEFQAKRYSPDLAPLREPPDPSSDRLVDTGQFGYSAEFCFAPPPDTNRIRFQIRIRTVSGPGKQDRVRVTDPKGAIVFEERIENDDEWHELNIPTDNPGTYVCAVTDQKNTFHLRVPASLPFVCARAYTCADLSPQTYFYVPRGLTQIAMFSPGVIPIKIYKPDGTLISVERNEQKKNVFLVPVGSGEDGQVWSFRQFKSWTPFRLLNCPNVFAFSPDGMMTPGE